MADTQPVRSLLQSRDPQVVAERMSELWSRVRLAPPDGHFSFSERVVVAEGVAVGRMQLAGNVKAQLEHPDMLVVGRVRSARRHSLTAGGTPIDTAQPLWLAAPDQVHEATLEDVEVEFFNIDLRHVEEVARELAADARFRLAFTGKAPVSHAAVRHWILTARHLQQDLLGNADAWANPILRAQGIRALATATLQLFPNNIDLSAEVGQVAPPAVRRAKQFIEDNLGSSISAQDIADAARVSLRGLQSAFRKHEGESPTAYLRRARLDAARADLLAAAPGVSVEQVARRWGFSHLGRFAHDYRAAFGQLPSATLRGECREG